MEPPEEESHLRLPGFNRALFSPELSGVVRGSGGDRTRLSGVTNRYARTAPRNQLVAGTGIEPVSPVHETGRATRPSHPHRMKPRAKASNPDLRVQSPPCYPLHQPERVSTMPRHIVVAVRAGFEPAQTRSNNPPRYRLRHLTSLAHARALHARRDSNSQPPGSKPGALIQLSYGRMGVGCRGLEPRSPG